MSIPSLADYSLPQPEDYPGSKVDWQLDSRKCALLIHDMQDYFVNFYQHNSVMLAQVIERISQLKNWAKNNAIPVYYTAQPAIQDDQKRGLLNDMWGAGLTAYPDQAKIVSQLAPDDSDHILVKWRYSAFYRSDLAEQMQQSGRDQLMICGVYAHIGVLQTAADAFMRGIKPFVIGDAAADFSRDDHLFALKYIQRNLGVVSTLNAVTENG